ncbi:hypothetical protein [Uliginosibacterium sediminicola]|uniref:Uncharacterized protein n=1 Tax=Uliginosibacterium sediminicola TaxID=2024550 RepID=A0ABU9YWB9_9RHOO
MKVTKEGIAKVLEGLVSSLNADIQQATQQDLEKYWHFNWDDSASLESNLYDFHKKLDLYGSFCRRWEETHNGHCCVVERVRDTYLMPKIREFAEKVRQTLLHQQ